MQWFVGAAGWSSVEVEKIRKTQTQETITLGVFVK
jgi:hypothetical protein